MNESTDAAARSRLEALIGEWKMQASPPGGAAMARRGSGVTFGWLEGAPLVQRTSISRRRPTAPR